MVSNQPNEPHWSCNNCELNALLPRSLPGQSHSRPGLVPRRPNTIAYARSLIWSGTKELDKNEIGSAHARGYWMPDDEMHASKATGLDLGLINWHAHVKALQTNWVLKYLDGSRGPWKTVLDSWVCRDPVDRAAIHLPTPGFNTFTSVWNHHTGIPGS